MQPLEDSMSAPGSQGEPSLQVSVQIGKHADPSLSLHQTGDQIVEVNGIDFSNLDHKEVRCVVFACWPLSPLPSTSRLSPTRCLKLSVLSRGLDCSGLSGLS